MQLINSVIIFDREYSQLATASYGPRQLHVALIDRTYVNKMLLFLLCLHFGRSLTDLLYSYCSIYYLYTQAIAIIHAVDIVPIKTLAVVRYIAIASVYIATIWISIEPYLFTSFPYKCKSTILTLMNANVRIYYIMLYIYELSQLFSTLHELF